MKYKGFIESTGDSRGFQSLKPYTLDGTPLYRCDKGERGCFIEGYDGDVILAGRKRRRRR